MRAAREAETDREHLRARAPSEAASELLREWHDWRGIHFPLGVVASLALLVAAAHFPVLSVHDDLEWMNVRVERQIEREMLPPTQTRHEERSGLMPPPSGSPSDDSAPVSKGAVQLSAPRTSEHVAADSAFEGALGKAHPLRPAPARGRITFSPTNVPLHMSVWSSTAEREPRLKFIDISHPRADGQEGIEGRVIVQFRVETDGRAYNVKVLLSLHPAYDAEVVRALKFARFAPAHRNGRKIPARSHLIVRFQLSRLNSFYGR